VANAASAPTNGVCPGKNSFGKISEKTMKE